MRTILLWLQLDRLLISAACVIRNCRMDLALDLDPLSEVPLQAAYASVIFAFGRNEEDMTEEHLLPVLRTKPLRIHVSMGG